MTDKGLRRDSNQDSCLVNTDERLYIVADGMGGHSGGEVASKIAVETLQETIVASRAKSLSPRDALIEGYEEASRRIYDKAANENPELVGMGTTMVSAYISGKNIFIANVGDSRCYLYKKPYLWQITEDHSLINEQLRAGILTEEQIKNFVGRNVITRSVGYEREVFPDVVERELTPGEIYLLCSDGLSGLVSDEKISEIFEKNPTDKVARICLDQALANGGDDNVSVMIIQIES